MSNAKFGAKEVMDVVLYDMETDKPVIQFDSLKTSSISVTSEKVYARGGKGNPKLITWEINKEATLTIEDALISPKSMELVSGIARKVGVQTIRMRQTTEYENGENKGKMYPLKADATGKIALAFAPNTDVSKILVYPFDSDCEEDALFDMTGATLDKENKTLSAASSGRKGNDATSTCATSPVANTLMAALPSALRAVMKPMTIYTDNTAGGSDTASYVTKSVDYLPLLAEFEIFGSRSYANSAEKNYQKQYDYYKAGNSKIKYRHNSTSSTALWWERSPYYGNSYHFCYVDTNGYAYTSGARYSFGLAPAFRV